MKKSLVALAALAVAGVASAQSSVTLFGVVDASISHYETSSRYVNTNPFFVPVAGVDYSNRKQSATVLANSGYNSSRLGFRGTEDLGGGLAASFWLEAPLSNDDGSTSTTFSFARRSTVSLSGGFGEVRLGRDYNPTFWNDTVFDPFGTNGVGTNLISNMNGAAIFGPGNASTNANYVRASNSIGYFLPPNLGGFYGQLQYAFHEKVKYDPGLTTPAVANNSRTGRNVAARFGYANGPLDVAFAVGQSTVGDQFYPGITSNVKIANLGASYDFGVVKLFSEISQTRNKNDFETQPVFGAVSDFKGNGYLLGVTVPVGAGLIRASYSWVKVKFDNTATSAGFFQTDSPDAKANKFAIGYVHNLSKRTALYATVARTSNKNGLALTTGGTPAFTNTFAYGVPNAAGYQARNATGYDFGIRHAF
ncbi:porin [Variovorax sp. RT4R15]|uniref:porin n=1 Tax=Variovorax sp. RT4R15 TaxID=3443737 RepID=UPI003F45ADA2